MDSSIRVTPGNSKLNSATSGSATPEILDLGASSSSDEDEIVEIVEPTLEHESVYKKPASDNGYIVIFESIVLRYSEPEPEELQLELPKIMDEMLNDINRVLESGDDNEVLAKPFITRGDLKTLIPSIWLNDDVIHSYIELIVARSQSRIGNLPKVHIFPTFFYPKFKKEGYSDVLKRWTRKLDVFSFDLLLFPIHLGIHWCLAAVDFRDKSIRYYDSLLGNRTVCQVILIYLTLEMKARKEVDLNPSEWNLESMKNIPTQENESDCGVFTCKFAEYLSRDVKLTFRREDMDYYRQRMIYEIIRQDLLYP